VATVVGVLATGALVFYSALTRTGPTVDEVLFVLSSITVPVTVASESLGGGSERLDSSARSSSTVYNILDRA
jgi:hypothetical protein